MTRLSHAPLATHEAKAIGHLAGSIAGLATATRAIASQRRLDEAFTTEPLQWSRDGLAAYDLLALAEAQAEEPSSEEPTGDGLARAAIAQLSYVAEALVTALECIAAGHAASSREVVGAMIQADAHLTEALRIPSDDEFKTTLRALWGREEMPVRIR